MKILLCHNYYQNRGGEDASFEEEANLLVRYGHTVHKYTVHNNAIEGLRGYEVAKQSLWSRKSYDELLNTLRGNRFDILHCTNTFPLISLAAYDAARSAGVPIVQSLRNYRFLCPTSFFMRNNRVCTDCLGRSTAWPGIWHACYRNSRAATAVVAAVSMYHRFKRLTARDADCYYTLTEFARQKFIEGGFPSGKVFVKSNFVDPDPGIGSGAGGYAVFAGRLSQEKGIDTLLAAWNKLSPSTGCPGLKIVGDGPLASQVQAASKQNPRIEWLGELSLPDTLKVIGEAAALVMPSVWYETFGRTVIEAFASGTPVIASRLGAMIELVADGSTGLHFTAGDADDLAAKVTSLFANTDQLVNMRIQARLEYESKYTADRNYKSLLSIYERVVQNRSIANSNGKP